MRIGGLRGWSWSIGLSLSLGMPLWAQSEPPASQPATLPTSAPATMPVRRMVEAPQGFHRVSVFNGEGRGDYHLLCQDEDEAWALKALQNLGPTTRPTTMPADLLSKLKAGREKLIAEMAADLALSDTKMLADYIDTVLAAKLQRLSDWDFSLLYMPVTKSRLKELVRSGWESGQFQYNKAADDVFYRPVLIDESVAPCIYEEEDAPEARARKLVDLVRKRQSMQDVTVASLGMETVQGQMIQFIGAGFMEPLKLPRDQQWLGMGIATYLATKYTAELTGLDHQRIVRFFSTDPSGAPIHSAPIDLVHPAAEADLRSEAVAFYLAAMRRKSLAVVNVWVSKGGDQVIPKILAAVRAKLPANGEALVKLVQETTGVDLSGELASK